MGLNPGYLGSFSPLDIGLPKPELEMIRFSKNSRKKSPYITFVTLFLGREWVLDKWLDSLKAIRYPRDQVMLLWVWAGNKKSAYGQKLVRALESLNNYHTKTLIFNPRLPRYFGEDGHIRHRIICDVYNFSKIYLESSDFVFLLEDDVIVPPTCVEKLLRLMDNPRIGESIGFLRYRPMDGNHGTPLVWEFTPTLSQSNGHVSKGYNVSCVPQQDRGVEEVGSGTFGCTLIREPLWKDTPLIPWSDSIFGTDVNFGHQIRQKGYKTMIDWSVCCKHYFKNKRGKLVYV
jgi:hypothetical protein